MPKGYFLLQQAVCGFIAQLIIYSVDDRKLSEKLIAS